MIKIGSIVKVKNSNDMIGMIVDKHDHIFDHISKIPKPIIEICFLAGGLGPESSRWQTGEYLNLVSEKTMKRIFSDGSLRLDVSKGYHLEDLEPLDIFERILTGLTRPILKAGISK